MISTLETLKMKLREAIRQLEQAELAMDSGELPEASVRVQMAKGILMKLGVLR